MKLRSIFIRGNISSVASIAEWWFNGVKYVNLFYLLYILLQLAISMLVFDDGWIGLLIVPMLCLGLLLNFVFVLGLLFELIITKLLKIDFDINSYAPLVKKGLFILAGMAVLLLSASIMSKYF